MSARQGTTERRERELDEDELEPGDEYGYTFGLTSDGDLRINDLKELPEIHDENAVVQDLKVALATKRGEDPIRPEYGLDTLAAVGEGDMRLRAEIGRTIGPNADPRVARVNEIEIERQPGQREDVNVIVTVTLRDGTLTTFEFIPRQRIRR